MIQNQGKNRTISATDEKAFDGLFRQYFPRLEAYARKFVLDANVAQDIVQEAFISIWEKETTIQLNTFENFLFISVRNACINYLKKQVVEQKKLEHIKENLWVEEIYRIDFLKDAPLKLIADELQDEIDKVMSDLPPRCKEVFKLSREEGLKNREIAERLGINIKNVERHISTALQKFRAKFGNELGVLVFFALFPSLL
ncbi:RNA polymerase sigma-70 factor [Prolixibacteraceae bacterium JC049]|nr:RNA polymerase sigma-70 factor [Prolixibacteraceae bacterium JC049]